MTDRVVAALTGKHPSLPLAVASLIARADSNGAVRFGELAVTYREDHLELQRQEFGEMARQRGVLSVDEVRRHLHTSVLPRLARDGILEAPPEKMDDAATVRFRIDTWESLASDWRGWRERLLAVALDAIRAAEAIGQAVVPSGSTLRGRALTKSYRRRVVVDRVDIDVRQGEIVGLLGPNGAGKTTTFYMIMGLERPDAGRIFIDDDDVSGMPMYQRARRGIGYLAQEPSAFRKLTVEENVLAILEHQGLREPGRRARLDGLLDELSIAHLRDVPAYKLSGGERRRLEITRALVAEPKFMLLDEPFAGVDPIAVNDIQTIVAGLRGRGIGVLITDHSVEQTLDIVDRAYIMFEGKVQVSGSVRDLVFDDRVADAYFGPTLTARLRARLTAMA
ncbi:MAG TPA: LPS export ABC transporter ATP-binding protein [Gemmatimonadales bacterium]|jgi:lipopolysaccharide export system ATP-binding protein